jgi:hypothetical protein
MVQFLQQAVDPRVMVSKNVPRFNLGSSSPRPNVDNMTAYALGAINIVSKPRVWSDRLSAKQSPKNVEFSTLDFRLRCNRSTDCPQRPSVHQIPHSPHLSIFSQPIPFPSHLPPITLPNPLWITTLDCTPTPPLNHCVNLRYSTPKPVLQPETSHPRAPTNPRISPTSTACPQQLKMISSQKSSTI